MPLPANDVLWPPPSLDEVYGKLAEWAAWYSGEPSRIIDVYAATQASAPVPWWRFWSRARQRSNGAQRAVLHVPIASDLAGVSGALLFGEPMTVRIRPAREDEEPTNEAEQPVTPGAPPAPDPTKPFDPAAPPAPLATPKPKRPATTPEQKAEKRLLEIIEESDVNSRLVEAAESAAAMGGVYIYPGWDKDIRDCPFMMVAQADMAVPEFTYGFLTAVTFHRVVETRDNHVYRHLERHEVEGTGESRKAVILHALYIGTGNRLGSRVPLTESDHTASLEPRVELPFFDRLDVEYVPNIRPNRLWRASALGVADIQGSETLLDALDEVYASWIRDVRLAKARIIVPRDYLRLDENKVPAFDIDQEIYVPLDMEPGLTQDARAMLAHQFEIRYLEHRSTAQDLIERVISNAGYTPTTVSHSGDTTDTGTALRISEHKTLLTLRRKSTWWKTAVANVLHRMLIIDEEIFDSGVKAIKPTIDMSDAIIDNPLELAQTTLAMKTAEAASIETRVRVLHPDWSEAEVDAEVERIKGELEAAKPPVPVIAGKGPKEKFGNADGDPASQGNVPVTDQQKGAQPASKTPTSPPFAKKQ